MRISLHRSNHLNEFETLARLGVQELLVADLGDGLTAVGDRDETVDVGDLLEPSVPAGEALGSDAEFVAFGILHGRPPMTGSGQRVLLDDSRAASDEASDRCRIGIDQIEVDAVLRPLRFGNLREVPRWLVTCAVRSADRGVRRARAVVDRQVEQGRPEAGDLLTITDVRG